MEVLLIYYIKQIIKDLTKRNDELEEENIFISLKFTKDLDFIIN